MTAQPQRFLAVLNRDGGTLRGLDCDALGSRIEAAFAARGKSANVEISDGGSLRARLEHAFASGEVDAVIAGGGDGTVSSAGALAWRTGKPFGVIPAGTMNLFARSLGMPLALDAAIEALAGGEVAALDVASANGRPFLHQFSVGLHPRLIRVREEKVYNSRLGKMAASLMAIAGAVRNPPVFPVEVAVDGTPARRMERATSVIVSNNGYGNAPYAERLDGGELHLYLTHRRAIEGGMRFLVDVLLGSWRNNPHVEDEAARGVTLRFPRLASTAQASIDGELTKLEAEVELLIHPGELPTIVPAVAG